VTSTDLQKLVGQNPFVLLLGYERSSLAGVITRRYAVRTLQQRPDPIGRTVTPTLVFGVCGRTGSGASFVATALAEELKAFGYDIEVIKVARQFLDDLETVKKMLPDPTDLFDDNDDLLNTFLQPYHVAVADLSSVSRRILLLQRRGDLLRKNRGLNYLAALCLKRILDHLDSNEVLGNPKKRQAYIIDSLKNPAEVDLLRTVFHDGFCMIGAVADDTVRKQRLEDQKGIQDSVFDAISEIDAGESQEDHGQHATGTILQSDYFFENNFDKPAKIKSECARLLNLLFQSEIETPRMDEYGMHIAHMAADRSACLSRQVGAAIISSTDTVLATGHNDVPKFGGGLYTTETDEDYRCFAKSAKCHNDEEKQLLANQIIHVFKSKNLPIDEDIFEKMKSILLKETRLKLLIEFSRAVHAEMDAIISVARDGKPGLVGSTMYVTTYPCHNCAKHIVDAGIKRVVYLEPYSKSLAQKLYSVRRQYNSVHIEDLSSGKSGAASQANPALKRPAPVDAPPADAFSASWAGRTEPPVFPPATPHAAMPYACPDAKAAAARCPTD
jgi:deoxycytidylate deaminase